ncbi:DUF262 domain-containing protein [Micromonospora sp. H61]|uniref:DUF262 domain-containing protein n=1 Tax=Micromonospora sp. H61 TaxID=2824888 RepID=UPI001B38F4C3|nr:DUF262 domain-containing protein [Micromonospora sp. H61]MBQ0994847.1 DUF262 domain-containing protein [Micromonospora sp. H61]
MSKYTIDSIGLGALLAQRRFGVPTYQRAFAWGSGEGRDEVEDFWNDLLEAFESKSDEAYFLGTVVLSENSDYVETDTVISRSFIIDGQQRLTTTFLLLLAVRDAFKQRDDNRSSDIEQQYIASRDLRTRQVESRLQLGATDNEYLQTLIEGSPKPLDRQAPPSHKLLAKGLNFLKAKVEEDAANAGAAWAARLVDWVEFIHERALVITVTVPTESDAFLIFETLNDRGIDLTIADLTKNYIFSRAGGRLSECHERWIATTSYIEQATGTGSKFTDFLRYYFTSQQGSTREREIFVRVKNRKLTTAADAVAFSDELKMAARAYSRLLGADPTYWPSIHPEAASYVEALRILEVERLRPVLLAAMLKFPNAQLKALLKLAVSAAVRMRISKTAEGSKADRAISEVAQAISQGKTTKAAAVISQLGEILPSDEQFRNDFATAAVRRPSYARYYLRSLEIQNNQPRKIPEFVANPNAGELNLEHVLPQSAGAEWDSYIPRDRHTEYAYRLGNQVLLRATENKSIGNSAFAEKRPILAASSLSLTQTVGDKEDWTMEEIEARQRMLADLAIEFWKLP